MGIQDEDNQLLSIINFFKEINLHYWIDSGSLLGLTRGGELLKGDNDIDFGIWSGTEEKIIKAFDEYLKEDYSLKKYFYKKKLYKLKLIPLKLNLTRKVDINIFFRYEDSAWCFQSLFFKKDNKFFYFFMAIIEYSFTAYYIKSMKNLFYGKYPLLLLRRPGFWKVPLEYFDKTESLFHKGLNIKTPNNSADYLSLRYGNWKVPKKKWSFMVDDGLLVRKFPKALLKVI